MLPGSTLERIVEMILPLIIYGCIFIGAIIGGYFGFYENASGFFEHLGKIIYFGFAGGVGGFLGGIFFLKLITKKNDDFPACPK